MNRNSMNINKNIHTYKQKSSVVKCLGKTQKGGKCKLMTKHPNGYCTSHQGQCKPQNIIDKPKECCICMESTDNIKTPLECGHWIHLCCLEQGNKLECPMCRAVLKNLPKHVSQKIKRNKKEYEKEQQEENNVNIINMLLEEYIEDMIEQGIPLPNRATIDFGNGIPPIEVSFCSCNCWNDNTHMYHRRRPTKKKE